ncbi:hypothetical protein BRADI_4g16676v3 [Brachypodium distachyon]|uniref:Uncharacterized protein n=1 Tax=Brachypodium distachyon TaxID=15368 RepID=A0A2K2CNA2_BRADI|nr:hypothetical protein BRADI_4g16676v3 [Brachypodium distachyon]
MPPPPPRSPEAAVAARACQDADRHGRAVRAPRHVLHGRLRQEPFGWPRSPAEVFDCSTSPWINSLVVDAVDSWGLRDLEVVATPTEPFAHPPPVYRFPHGRISGNPGASRLRSLKLGNCLPPPLQGFAALTTLVLKRLAQDDARCRLRGRACRLPAAASAAHRFFRSKASPPSSISSETKLQSQLKLPVTTKSKEVSTRRLFLLDARRLVSLQ